jgi:putative transposase
MERIGDMPLLLLFVFRFARLLLSGHQAVAIESAALRMQIAAFQRKRKRPLLTIVDRIFWVALRSVVVRLATSLLYVQADTVVRWQRERFRKFWARLSNPQRQRRGRPGTAAELRRLIEQIAAANPLWRAPRIHGELKMLGIAISERTVSRILRRLRRPPNQTWRTFLHNHVGQMVSIDFFTVPTISMRVLFVVILLEHDRRKVLHFNVTEHPTGAWTAQQIVEALQTERPPSISSAIATAGTVLKFDCESSRWVSRRFSQHREVPGRIHTPSDSSARFEGSA